MWENWKRHCISSFYVQSVWEMKYRMRKGKSLHIDETLALITLQLMTSFRMMDRHQTIFTSQIHTDKISNFKTCKVKKVTTYLYARMAFTLLNINDGNFHLLNILNVHTEF